MTVNRFPTQGRLLAIDYGHVRLGVAVCDPEQTIASPLTAYQRQDEDADRRFLQSLVDTQQIVGIVIGLPVHTSGSESQKSREARSFGAWVGRVTGLPVRFHDERYSTAVAEHSMIAAGMTRARRRRRRDMLAAQVILASYLESARHRELPPEPLDDSET